MLVNLATSYLLPAELAEITSNYVNVLEDQLEIDPYLQQLTNLLKTDLSNLNQAITAVRRNPLIEAVSQADEKRDNSYLAFRDTVANSRRRPSTAVVEAAERILPLLERTGTRIYRYGYTEKSGRLDALIEQLDKAENQAYIARISATELYSELKAAQANFTLVYQQRLNNENNLLPTQSAALREIVPHINALLSGLSIQLELNQDTYLPIAEKFNAFTSEIMSVARARRTREENRTVQETMAAMQVMSMTENEEVSVAQDSFIQEPELTDTTNNGKGDADVLLPLPA